MEIVRISLVVGKLCDVDVVDDVVDVVDDVVDVVEDIADDVVDDDNDMREE